MTQNAFNSVEILSISYSFYTFSVNKRFLLYVRAIEFHEESDVITELEDVINLKLGNQFSNLTAEKVSDTEWKINFLEELRIGHEAHFAQVTLKFLKYLENNSLPDWEVPNMISKYYTTIEGYKKAKRSPQKE